MTSQTRNNAHLKEKKNSKPVISEKKSSRRNNHMTKSLVNMDPNCYVTVPFTKEMFLDRYSMGKWNLSSIPRPDCLNNTSFLKAPEAFNEVKRLKTVSKYLDLPHWGRTNRFNLLLQKMIKLFNCRGASISLLNARFQILKYQIGLGFNECSRQVSLDSHTILSSIFFMLLDASKDWRTESNPLVKGVPNIKFYLGVPLICKSNKEVIGVLSIFDSFPRQKVEEETIMTMKKMASEIMDFLDAPLQSNDSKLNKSGFNINATSKLLSPSKITSDCNNKENGSDPRMDKITKLLEQYGRATSIDCNLSKIIFERDGSGTSYQHHSMLKFNKYFSPYNELIDFNVWDEFIKCNDIKSGCQKLCEILISKFNFDCFYIVNVRTTEMKRIKSQYFPDEREIEIDNYKYQDKLETARGEEYIKLKIFGMKSKVKGIDNEWGLEFHKSAQKSENGLIYKNEDEFNYQFQRGIVLPFFRTSNKLTRRKKFANKSTDKLELYLKTNGFMIGGFSKNGANHDLTVNEIGYIYGCASLLRRIYF